MPSGETSYAVPVELTNELGDHPILDDRLVMPDTGTGLRIHLVAAAECLGSPAFRTRRDRNRHSGVV